MSSYYEIVRHAGPYDFAADCKPFAAHVVCIRCGAKPENPDHQTCAACQAKTIRLSHSHKAQSDAHKKIKPFGAGT